MQSYTQKIKQPSTNLEEEKSGNEETDRVTYSKEVSPRHDPATRKVSTPTRDMNIFIHIHGSSYQRHTQFTATASVVSSDGFLWFDLFFGKLSD